MHVLWKDPCVINRHFRWLCQTPPCWDPMHTIDFLKNAYFGEGRKTATYWNKHVFTKRKHLGRRLLQLRDTPLANKTVRLKLDIKVLNKQKCKCLKRSKVGLVFSFISSTSVLGVHVHVHTHSWYQYILTFIHDATGMFLAEATKRILGLGIRASKQHISIQHDSYSSCGIHFQINQ